MLKSISCGKLIETPLVFSSGLNVVIGADDAHNSIGKSSLLMLIDFAFGGADFPVKCDDIIRNIEHFEVGIEFEFERPYSFVRNTKTPDVVYRIEDKKIIPLDEFNGFLKEKYFQPDTDTSFRQVVSGFFRIYQRNNYNDDTPLHIVDIISIFKLAVF